MIRLLILSAVIFFLLKPVDAVDFFQTGKVTYVGDCNGDGKVTISEVITCVNIALEQRPLAHCPVADSNKDKMVSINELICTVNNAIHL